MIVSVPELKTHLRIQHDEEDEYIGTLIAQAQAAAEDYCRVNFEPEDDETYVCPATVKLAVMLMASFYYENRDIPDVASYNGMRRAFHSLLYPHRDPVLMF